MYAYAYTLCGIQVRILCMRKVCAFAYAIILICERTPLRSLVSCTTYLLAIDGQRVRCSTPLAFRVRVRVRSMTQFVCCALFLRRRFWEPVSVVVVRHRQVARLRIASRHIRAARMMACFALCIRLGRDACTQTQCPNKSTPSRQAIYLCASTAHTTCSRIEL